MAVRSGITGFFLYAGLGFAAFGAYLAFQGSVGGSAGTTFMLMGFIWVVVALGIRRFYGKLQKAEQEDRALFASGTKALGIIEEVETTGTVLNRVNHQIRLRVRVRPAEGEEFVHERTMYVPVNGIPHPGDLVDVAYDPRDRSRVALATDPRINTAGGRMLLLRRPESEPEAAAGDGVIEQLERLEQLRRSGALTQSEFDAQKRRILEL
ncbi:MAG TPA: SHOCT domain-containing protein [Candidatus Kapabacteria bacterium]|nr:SHOCT domain-containing protein [Candidatus Kapabacteria bacterium]